VSLLLDEIPGEGREGVAFHISSSSPKQGKVTVVKSV
jgi:hypothetical protein